MQKKCSRPVGEMYHLQELLSGYGVDRIKPSRCAPFGISTACYTTMADDSFLEASSTNGGGNIQMEGEESSGDEYERMTAAEVLEKLEEVSVLTRP